MSTDYVVDLVRRQDRDRFVAGLFAPAIQRAHLFALYAVNIELAHIPDTVSEPMIGQMRLQWWRDVVERLSTGGAPPAGHPVSAALAQIPNLDHARLTALIDAREPELAGAGKAAVVEPTATVLATLALDALGVTDEPTRAAAREGAIALGLARLHGANAEERAAHTAHARDHVAAARARTTAVDRRALPVLLWTTAAEARLRNPAAPAPVVRMSWNAWRRRY